MSDHIDDIDHIIAAPERAPLLSPAVVIAGDRVRRNIAWIIGQLDGDPDRWRPHAKTTKIPSLYVALARAGIRAFKCATTREARHLLAALADAGFEDVDLLAAHPWRGPALQSLATLAASFPRARLSLIVEDTAVLEDVPPNAGIFVDVNPGMDRTGIPVTDIDAIRSVAAAAGPRFRGVHYYDGHITGGDPASRRQRAWAAYDRLLPVLDALASGGHVVEEIVTSGSPTFCAGAAYPRFRERTQHRVSPGTVVLHDQRSIDEVPELALVPAAFVLTRVISHPAPGIVTTDAGSKSIAAEAGDPCAAVLGHPHLVPLTPSEEHLPLRVTNGAAPPRGTELLLVPRHVCPTINLAEEVVLTEGGRVRAVEAVTARAHDLRLGAVVPRRGAGRRVDDRAH